MITPTNGKTGHLELVQDKARGKISVSGALEQIHGETIAAVKQLIDHMFASTDDLFYELSKRASTNNEQSLYFDSMREIRIKKEGLRNLFLQSAGGAFNTLLSAKAHAAHKKNNDPMAGLAIVEGDDLEIELALKNMSSRARDSFKSELFELNIRLSELLPTHEVNEDNNPIDPQQISRAFVNACIERLNINIKIRLILFKLFEKHVLKQLGNLYYNVNQMMIANGIMPKLPRREGQSSSPPNTHRTQEEEQSQSASAPEQQATISISPGTLATLMSAIRKESTGKNEPSNVHYHIYTNNPGPQMSPGELASTLTNKQTQIENEISESSPQNLLHDLIQELLVKQSPSKPKSLAQPQEDTINLVAMFFDKVLEDESLPASVQSLICRLQIPVLKTAIKDRRFLSDATHPARKLINTITQAGLQFDESKSIERDGLYRVIADGVRAINNQYTIDDNLFEQVHKSIEKTIEKEKHRSNVVENRTNQTERGKAKIKHARSYTQSVLFERMKSIDLPQTVSEFLSNTWMQVLIITYIKEGHDSAQWVENEQLISDLIWLCEPHSDERSKARSQRIKPEIMARIEKGLSVAIDNPQTRTLRINEIEETIERLVIESSNCEPVSLQGLSDDQKEALGKTETANKSWDEMSAQERLASNREELSNEYYIMAKNLPTGTWVNYQSDTIEEAHITSQKGDGQQTDSKNQVKITRCKLSTKIDANTYIFVNRLGFKTGEKTRRQFAYDMQFGKASILDSTALFDRIMNNIFHRNHKTAKAL
ncbi:MAG: hypothetical protein COA42_02420 [Alteromonadaceae bacterium]|nr:MAG: hypothetical protein COA42_02420 [Alteromonadaceae bacterium]